MERTQVLQIRISPEEKERITCNAELAGMKPAPYVRSMALHAKDDRQTEAQENESFKKPEEIKVSVHEGYTDEQLRAMNADKDPETYDVQNMKLDENGSVVVDPEAEFKRRVNRHALRMSQRKAEAIVKKEME